MKHNGRRIRTAGLLATALLVISISGCAFTQRTGELQIESEVIELDGAETADVGLRMGAGELTLSGGADALAEAEFTYNVAAWEPMIDYVVSGDEGQLWIEQPEVGNLGLESYRYAWDVRLNNEVPLALEIDVGAGESALDLSALTVTTLDLNVGVGGVEVDLTGSRDRDVDVAIRGGVGEATVLLPDQVGVSARVGGGLGEIDANGLTQQDGIYVNEVYGDADSTITLDIEGGIGGVTLTVVD